MAQKYNIPLRPDWEFLKAKAQIDAGEYDKAVLTLTTYLNDNNLSPEKRADVISPLGFAKAKSGNQEKGQKLLQEGLEKLSHLSRSFINKDKDVIAIWKTGAMIKLAQVIDDREKAKNLVQEALKEATEEKLGARVQEARNLLKKSASR